MCQLPKPIIKVSESVFVFPPHNVDPLTCVIVSSEATCTWHRVPAFCTTASSYFVINTISNKSSKYGCTRPCPWMPRARSYAHCLYSCGILEVPSHTRSIGWLINGVFARKNSPRTSTANFQVTRRLEISRVPARGLRRSCTQPQKNCKTYKAYWRR